MNLALIQEFHYFFANQNTPKNMQLLDKKSYYVYSSLMVAANKIISGPPFSALRIPK